MPVYILRPDERYVSLNRQAALIGFAARGEELRLFDEAEFDDLPLTRDDIVVGGVGFVRRALQKLGLAVPAVPSIPTSLTDFAGRKIWRSTLIEAQRAAERGEAVFVKPLPHQTKLFTGQPLRSFDDVLRISHLPGDLEVECAELTPFVSEYRVFVLHREIIGVRHYRGDPLVFPEAARIRAAVAAYDDAPAGYALDVGVVEDGRTLLVEVNDSYATGAYGLAPIRYAALIEARWSELRAQPAEQQS